MSYIQGNLMPNERILFSARMHPAIFLPAGFYFLLSIALAFYGLEIMQQQEAGIFLLPDAFFLFMALPILYFSLRLGLQAAIAVFTTEFAVTNRRVFGKTGFIRRNTLEILLQKVESVAVHQSILGRLFNFGTVTITGTGGTREQFRAIVKPFEVRRNINQVIEHYSQIDAQPRSTPSLRASG